MVEVILRKDVADLGLAGEMVNVRPGYARNYLIPQGIALVATEGTRKRFEEELSFLRRASESGRLFGSVTAADVADELEKEGVSVDRRTIRLDDPIKDLGEHEVPVRVHMDVEPVLKVSVVAEE